MKISNILENIITENKSPIIFKADEVYVNRKMVGTVNVDDKNRLSFSDLDNNQKFFPNMNEFYKYLKDKFKLVGNK